AASGAAVSPRLLLVEVIGRCHPWGGVVWGSGQKRIVVDGAVKTREKRDSYRRERASAWKGGRLGPARKGRAVQNSTNEGRADPGKGPLIVHMRGENC